jgi:malonyl CoA-acyl carrier protein transacylase
MIAWVFPGQGSQVLGMGRGLFGEVREYASVEAEVNALMGYSVRELCLEDPGSLLKQTQYTQPCLFVVNTLHYYKALQGGGPPACVAGHSLGEFNALLAAGVFDFLTGLRLVKKRGELMSQARGGGMAAVIGLAAPQVAGLLREAGLATLDIANFNSPTQTVISGPEADIACARTICEKAGAALYVPLQVSAAFHSRYVEGAAKAFAEFLAPMRFAAPQLPVIANATAEPYPRENAAEAIKSLLVRQMTHAVRWTQSVRYLMSLGVSDFREIGPGNVLSRLIHQIRQASR